MILLFNGPPSSGKDYACSILEDHGFTHVCFKEKLYTDTFDFFNVSREWFMSGYTREQKNTPDDRLILKGTPISRREALIYVSEEYMKPKYGASYYGDILADSIDIKGKYCVSDGGFKEEILPVINKVGLEKIVIVQLVRTECSFVGDSRGYLQGMLHKEIVLGSKTYIKEDFQHIGLPVPTYRLYNNGSLDDFAKTIKGIPEIVANDRKENKNSK